MWYGNPYDDLDMEFDEGFGEYHRYLYDEGYSDSENSDDSENSSNSDSSYEAPRKVRKLNKEVQNESLPHGIEIFESQDNDTGFFDVTFEIEGIELYAHRLILSRSCEFFSTMFSNQALNGNPPIQINNCTFNDFKEFISFSYSGKFLVTNANVLVMIDLAELYRNQRLKNACDNHFSKLWGKVVSINAFSAYGIAKQYSLEKSKEALLEHITSDDSLKSPEILNLSKDSIKDIIMFRKDDTDKVFELAYNWADNRCKNQLLPDNDDINEAIKLELSELIPHIRLTKLTSAFFKSFVVPHRFLFSDAVWNKMVMWQHLECEKIHQIFESQDVQKGFFDVTFEIEGKKLHANKVILGRASETFRVMFSNRWSTGNSHFKIENYSFIDFKQFLSFLYSGKLSLTKENSIVMVDLAEYYGVQLLKKQCDKSLSNMNYKSDDVVLYYNAAIKYDLEKSEKALLKFITNNLSETFKNPGFLELSKDAFLGIVASETRCGIVLFIAIDEWVKNRCKYLPLDVNANINEVIKRELSDFISHMRQTNFTIAFFNSYVALRRHLFSDANWKKIIIWQHSDRLKSNLIFETQDVLKGFFDVIFEVEGKKLYAHEFILTKASEPFRDMFSKLQPSATIPYKIKNCSFNDFKLFLSYLYSGNLTFTEDNINAIADLAESYGVQLLKNKCDESLSVMNLQSNNALRFYNIATKYALKTSKRVILDFIIKNFFEILNHPGFLELSKDAVIAIITNQTFFDDAIFKAVFEWAENRCRNQPLPEDVDTKLAIIKDELADIIPHIRFTEFTSDFFKNFVVPRKFIFSTDDWKKVEYASKFPLLFIVSNYGNFKIKGKIYGDGVTIDAITNCVKTRRIVKDNSGCYWKIKLKTPTTPSKVTIKRKTPYYLLICFKTHQLSIKTRANVNQMDYLIGEFFGGGSGELDDVCKCTIF